MKDLKHYFTSPKGAQSISEVKEALNGDSAVAVGVKNDELSGSYKEKTKKKRRKRKLNEDEEEEISLSDVSLVSTPVDKKKRRKSVDILKTQNVLNETSDDAEINHEPQTNELSKKEKKKKNSIDNKKKSLDSSSSKENSLSDIDEKRQDDCTTPEPSKSLLKYFSKVDKLPEIPEKPRIVKVEVLVHADSNGSTPGSAQSSGKRTSSIKRKKKKKENINIDFDLITSEELPPEDIPNTPVSSIILIPGEQPSASSDNISLIIDDNSEETKELNNKKSKSKKVKSKNKSDKKQKDALKITSGNEESSSANINQTDDVIFVKCEAPKENSKVKQDGNEVKSGADMKHTDDVLFVKYETPKEKPKVKHDGTLASFFNLGNKGAPISQERKVAKQLFLASSAPPSIKKISAATSVQGNIAPFPSLSHVQQRDKMNILWNLNRVQMNFAPAESSIDVPPWSNILGISSVAYTPSIEKGSFDSKTAFKNLKKELNLFPIGCWQKELKKMKKSGDGLLWTERYRPHISSAFLANARSISNLKAWLTELKESSNSDSAGSSGDEFVQDDEDRRKEKKTVALLTGPPGTGKTAAVYTVAEEIGYNVLELNASSNRSGKRILNEFSEAMKSHKVGVSKLNFTKVKKKKEPEDPKRNLILIEDADLLFEDDEGFVPTLLTLGASTKRPIILIANNPQAKHFAKLSSLFHTILPFVPPTQDRLGSWLRTVSLVEGFQLNQEDSELLASSLDLRKSLLQLQLSRSFLKGNPLEVDNGCVAWERAGSLDLGSKEERIKACRLYSALTAVDLIRQHPVEREALPYWYRSPEDSTLTVENKSLPSVFLDDIHSSLLGLVSSELPPPMTSHRFETPRNMVEIEKDVCNMIGVLNRRSLSLDVWPTLRHISRSEAVRLASHTKRNNRYFNYLASVGVKGPPDLLQSLAVVFSNRN